MSNLTELPAALITEELSTLPYFNYMQELISSLEFLVGGIFGLYLIFVLFKAYETYQFRRSLRHLNRSIDQLRKEIKTMHPDNEKALVKRYEEILSEKKSKAEAELGIEANARKKKKKSTFMEKLQSLVDSI